MEPSVDVRRMPVLAALLSNRYIVIYLSLSLLTGFLELGSVTYALRQGKSLPMVLGVALAYQAGALFKKPVELTRWQYRVLAVLAVVVGYLATWSFWWLALAIFILSASIQGIREEALQYHPVGTLAKRISRIVGFIGAGLFQAPALIVLPLLVLVMSCGLNAPLLDSGHHPGGQSQKLGVMGVAMIVHQSHYFTYAYALPILFLRLYGLTPVQAGVAFAIGWVSYSITPTLLSRYPDLRVLIAGHLGVAGVLIVMANLIGHNLAFILLAWFLSGFGGGTVFCIRRLAKRWGKQDKTGDMDLWENIGHVAGVAIAASLIIVTNQITALFLAASIFALSTVIIVLGRAATISKAETSVSA